MPASLKGRIVYSSDEEDIPTRVTSLKQSLVIPSSPNNATLKYTGRPTFVPPFSQDVQDVYDTLDRTSEIPGERRDKALPPRPVERTSPSHVPLYFAPMDMYSPFPHIHSSDHGFIRSSPVVPTMPHSLAPVPIIPHSLAPTPIVLQSIPVSSPSHSAASDISLPPRPLRKSQSAFVLNKSSPRAITRVDSGHSSQSKSDSLSVLSLRSLPKTKMKETVLHQETLTEVPESPVPPQSSFTTLTHQLEAHLSELDQSIMKLKASQAHHRASSTEEVIEEESLPGSPFKDQSHVYMDEPGIIQTNLHSNPLNERKSMEEFRTLERKKTLKKTHPVVSREPVKATLGTKWKALSKKISMTFGVKKTKEKESNPCLPAFKEEIPHESMANVQKYERELNDRLQCIDYWRSAVPQDITVDPNELVPSTHSHSSRETVQTVSDHEKYSFHSGDSKGGALLDDGWKLTLSRPPNLTNNSTSLEDLSRDLSSLSFDAILHKYA